eukprot:354901-Chlamydomonas_euryale.AAC.9
MAGILRQLGGGACLRAEHGRARLGALHGACGQVRPPPTSAHTSLTPPCPRHVHIAQLRCTRRRPALQSQSAAAGRCATCTRQAGSARCRFVNWAGLRMLLLVVVVVERRYEGAYHRSRWEGVNHRSRWEIVNHRSRWEGELTIEADGRELTIETAQEELRAQDTCSNGAS